jgi:hypothetical protein
MAGSCAKYMAPVLHGMNPADHYRLGSLYKIKEVSKNK